MYLHLLSRGISVLLSFIVFLIWAWNVLVGSVGAVWKLFSLIKFCILESYCCMGSMTMELPLSARYHGLTVVGFSSDRFYLFGFRVC